MTYYQRQKAEILPSADGIPSYFGRLPAEIRWAVWTLLLKPEVPRPEIGKQIALIPPSKSESDMTNVMLLSRAFYWDFTRVREIELRNRTFNLHVSEQGVRFERHESPGRQALNALRATGYPDCPRDAMHIFENTLPQMSRLRITIDLDLQNCRELQQTSSSPYFAKRPAETEDYNGRSHEVFMKRLSLTDDIQHRNDWSTEISAMMVNPNGVHLKSIFITVQFDMLRWLGARNRSYYVRPLDHLVDHWIAEWMEELTTPVLSACKKHGTPIRVEVPESHFLSSSQGQRLWDGIKEL